MNISADSLIAFIGVLLGFISISTAILEYRRQGMQKRANFFMEKIQEMWKDEIIKTMLDNLDLRKNSDLENTPFGDKIYFLVHLEEIALLLNSSLIRKDIAYYMFGYWVILCYESESFWKPNVNRDNKMWSLFRDLYNQMKEVDSTFEYKRQSMRF